MGIVTTGFHDSVVPIVSINGSKCLIYRVINDIGLPILVLGVVKRGKMMDFSTKAEADVFLSDYQKTTDGELWLTNSAPVTVINVNDRIYESKGITWVIADELLSSQYSMSRLLSTFVTSSMLLFRKGSSYLEPPRIGFVKHIQRFPILTNDETFGVCYKVFDSPINNEDANLLVYHFSIGVESESNCWYHRSIKRLYVP